MSHGCAGEQKPSGTEESPPRWPRFRRRFLIGFLAVVAISWWSGIFEEPLAWLLDSSRDPLPKDGRPAFLPTKLSTPEMPRNVSFRQRLIITYFEFTKKWRKRNPASYRFPPVTERLCGVYSLLNQCMEITGTRYMVAREAVGGSVMFGYTNALTGGQWVTAFENALRNNGLVLIREDQGRVKVIPKDRLDDYRKAGLIKKRN